MKKTVPGIEIPEGESCSFSNGEKCALFDCDLEGPAFCAGWGGLNLVGEGLKHEECLVLCKEDEKPAPRVRKPVLQDEKDFKNPRIPWNHLGKFALELDPRFPRQNIPNLHDLHLFKTDDNPTVVFSMDEAGKIELSKDGITVYVSGGDFPLLYQEVAAIRDGKGNLLWRKKKNQKPKKLSISQHSVDPAKLPKRLGLDRADQL